METQQLVHSQAFLGFRSARAGCKHLARAVEPLFRLCRQPAELVCHEVTAAPASVKISHRGHVSSTTERNRAFAR